MRILISVAHPDDPEFFCGGSIARWTREGHTVRYVLLTDGSKGNDDPSIDGPLLVRMRQTEQIAAAAELGVSDIRFLDWQDGELANTLALQQAIAREIRQFKPDIVVSTDPTVLHYGALRVNHNDHRVAGLATADAIFPASGNRMYFPALLEAGFEMHSPTELWFCGATHPNYLVDVSAEIERKIAAMRKHVSQVKQPEQVAQRMRQGILRIRADGSQWQAEAFRRVML
jgi:LmbE family N-acetylglucosaminyl deacetylase